ncbi:phosphoglucomutase [Halobacteriales archaeon QS_8_69_26]|nr:MAG: phosphoglucomutase [Halobacteriales archaeon QS_8_69_26]
MDTDDGAADDADPAAAITFGTDGWRARLSEFTDERVRMVAQAVASHLAEEGYGDAPVGVCYDARPTSRGFAEEVSRVLAANGHDVVLSDRDRPTPLLAWAVVDRGLAGGVMVTASHNPPEYNGVKFIPDDGAPALPEVTEAIEANLAAPDPVAPDEYGRIREADLAADHARHARAFVDADLSGLTVAYDAMHASGRDTTDALLEEAGADVVRLRCDRDPEFGGTDPEPSAENLEELIATVEDGEADLGVANDGDADRIALVTPGRGFLDENLFFAALYDHLLADDRGPAVRTVSTTYLIDRLAEAHGQSVVETAVGFKWVARAMAEHNALVGGEESGGFTVRGHVREKDGVLVALLAAAMAAEEPLDDRVDRLLLTHGAIHQDKVSVDCPDDRKAPVIDELGDRIPDAVAGQSVDDVVTTDGFKLLLADGSWLLVRPSGTEPKLRVYAEGESADRVAELLDAGRDLVEPLV